MKSNVKEKNVTEKATVHSDSNLTTCQTVVYSIFWSDVHVADYRTVLYFHNRRSV